MDIEKFENTEKNFLDTLEEKREKADKLIIYYAGGAAAVGAIPIPYADAPILIAGQINMIREILKIYGLETIVTGPLISAILLKQIVSVGGKYLVKSVAKIIPGVGSVISAGVAGTITYLLGKSISEVAYKISLDYYEGGEVYRNSEAVKKIINTSMEKSFSKLGDVSEEILDKILKKEKIEIL